MDNEESTMQLLQGGIGECPLVRTQWHLLTDLAAARQTRRQCPVFFRRDGFRGPGREREGERGSEGRKRGRERGTYPLCMLR